MHRELYSSFRDLCARHDKYAPDVVDKTRRRVGASQTRLEKVRAEKKDKWEIEEQKLTHSITDDNQTIERLLRRRLYIRYCIWNELSWLFTASTLLSKTLHDMAATERNHSDDITRNWASILDALQA